MHDQKTKIPIDLHCKAKVPEFSDIFQKQSKITKVPTGCGGSSWTQCILKLYT